jgi:hypothetical protein
MRELIERLEAATGPDREMDFAIAAAVGWPDSPHSHQHARRYSDSLDAALTLVPEGATWLAAGHPTQRARASVPVSTPAIAGATPALAICIAALRARMEASDA